MRASEVRAWVSLGLELASLVVGVARAAMKAAWYDVRAKRLRVRDDRDRKPGQ